MPDGGDPVSWHLVHQQGLRFRRGQGRGATAPYDLPLASPRQGSGIEPARTCRRSSPYQQETSQKRPALVRSPPRNGLQKTFLRAIGDSPASTGHAELEHECPGDLWGHSGGGVWASLMKTLLSRTDRRALVPFGHRLHSLGK